MGMVPDKEEIAANARAASERAGQVSSDPAAEANLWKTSRSEFRELASKYHDFPSTRSQLSDGTPFWQPLCVDRAVREDFNVAATDAALIRRVPATVDPVFHWQELLSGGRPEIPKVLAASAEYCADQEQLLLRAAAQRKWAQETGAGQKQAPKKFLDLGADPCDENPFPRHEVRHGIWQRATRRVEEELPKMTELALQACKARLESEWKRVETEVVNHGRPLNPISIAPVLVPYYQLKFDAWAWRALAAISDDRDLPSYDHWLVRHADNWLELLENTAEPEEQKRPVIDGLHTALQIRIGHWKSEARKHLRSQFEPPMAAVPEQPEAESSQVRLADQPDEAPSPVHPSMKGEQPGSHASGEFSSDVARNDAVRAYAKSWTCSEASLARTAVVDPADLVKWKKGLLPLTSGKLARIETALKNNDPPTPVRTSLRH
jgi:hypothetical protein